MGKKCGILFFFTLFLVIVLSGCGEKTVNEAKILEDLNASSLDFFVYHSVNFTSIEIEKRKTDEASKTDEVYVWVSGESDSLACRAGYLATYILYNDGWKLEEIAPHNPHEWTVTPKKGVDSAVLEKIIQENYVFDSLELSSAKESFEEGLAQYCYKLTSSYDYATQIDTVLIDCSLDPFTFEWVCIHDLIDQQDIWDLNGTWTATTDGYEDAYIELRIDEFTNNSFVGSFYIERMTKVLEKNGWTYSSEVFLDESGEFPLAKTYDGDELWLIFDRNGDITNGSSHYMSLVFYFNKDGGIRVSDVLNSNYSTVFMVRN